MSKKRYIIAIASLMFCVAFLATGFDGALAKTFVIKTGHVAPVEDEDQDAAMVFKDFLESQSKGQLKVEIYPAAQLGNYRQMLESVSLGTQEMCITTMGGAANIFPELQVTDIPYIFPNDRVVEKVYDGWFTDKLREHALKKQPTLRLMAVSQTGGWRCFATKNTLIKSPKDIKGLKIRTIESDLQINLVKALGGNPTPVPWAELYTAFKTGVVEGSKNGITDIINMKFHEMLKYITLDYHAYMGSFYWMNNDFYKSLPDDLKRIVLDGFYHLKWVSREYPKRTAIDAYETFKKAGGTVYVPTTEEKAQFVEASKPVREWYIKKYGKEWLDLLDKAVTEAEAEVEKERQKNM